LTLSKAPGCVTIFQDWRINEGDSGLPTKTLIVHSIDVPLSLI